jgi:4a-hydroxytetrahydrobiopterin dehydratase
MSEQSWKAFLGAEGLNDWVVLHGGPVVAFRMPSLSDSIFLIQAFVEAALICPEAVLTITPTRVTIRLTRDIWQINESHIEIARSISEIARSHGAVADRAVVQEVQIAVAAKPNEIDVEFWRVVLGYAQAANDNAIDPLGHGSTVWMQELSESKPLRHAMHLDVSVAAEHVQSRLVAAVQAGGRIVDDSHAPSHWTLSDRAGNRVCICAWPDGSADPAATNKPMNPSGGSAISGLDTSTPAAG